MDRQIVQRPIELPGLIASPLMLDYSDFSMLSTGTTPPFSSSPPLHLYMAKILDNLLRPIVRKTVNHENLPRFKRCKFL